MTETPTQFVTTECPRGHRVRGDLGWLNRTVSCPHCHAEFVFTRPESHPAQVVAVPASAERSQIQGGDPNEQDENLSPSDRQVLSVLGEYTPPKSEAEAKPRRCKNCGASVPVGSSVCYSCNMAFDAEIGATQEEPIDFVEVDKVAFQDVRVRRVVRPRRDIVFLDINDSLEEMQAKVRETMHSRYPVCNHSLDSILGVVHIKDILVADTGDIRSLLVTPERIPDSTPVSEVLQHFQVDDVPMAFVVDEYETVIGMVTMKDVLSKLVTKRPRVDVAPKTRPATK